MHNLGMRMMGASLLAIGCSLVGCQSEADDALVAAEHNDLGITQIEIDHGSIHGERLLTVRGLDEDGEQVATATLRTGMVLYGADVPEAWSAGTELTIAVGEIVQSYVTPDREPHQVDEPRQAELATFVRLHAVSAAIADEAGIQLTPPTGDGEVALAATSCSGANFPTSKGNPSQCCQDGANLWHKIPSGTSINLLAWRTAGTACRTSGGSSACTGAACNFGPCGSRVETVAGPNTTAAAVFTPTSAPTQCGRDSNGSAASGGIQAPEAFTGSQSLKPSVTASCGYSNCVNGVATYKLTVGDIDAGGASGWASSSGVGAYPDEIYTYYLGTDSADYAPGTVVTVYANVNTGVNRVTMTGCNQAGALPNVYCNVTMNSDTNISVQFSP